MLFLKWSTFNWYGYLLNLNLLAILDLKHHITVNAVALVWKTLDTEIEAREPKFVKAQLEIGSAQILAGWRNQTNLHFVVIVAFYFFTPPIGNKMKVQRNDDLIGISFG